MSESISKNQLLVLYTKIDAYHYKCKTCNKTYKTSNGGIGNLKMYCTQCILASWGLAKDNVVAVVTDKEANIKKQSLRIFS